MSEAREVFGYSIDEPRAWPWDGDLTRRAEVRDYNFDPPRVVRLCGYRACMRCQKPFWSEDVKLIRLCVPCKAPSYAEPMDDAVVAQRREYNRAYYRERRETWNK